MNRLEPQLAELADVLTRELGLIADLHRALLQQRDGVATYNADAIDDSVRAMGRTLLTFDEAGRRRASLISLITDTSTTQLAALEAHLGRPLPVALSSAGEAVRRCAAAAAREVAINQRILRGTVEAGESYLQQLFSGGATRSAAQLPLCGGPR